MLPQSTMASLGNMMTMKIRYKSLHRESNKHTRNIGSPQLQMMTLSADFATVVAREHRCCSSQPEIKGMKIKSRQSSWKELVQSKMR